MYLRCACVLLELLRCCANNLCDMDELEALRERLTKLGVDVPSHQNVRCILTKRWNTACCF